MSVLETIFHQISELVVPNGQPWAGLLLLVALFGWYVLATGVAGLIWPVPLPTLTEHEQVEQEVSREKEQLRARLRAENPVYRLAFLEKHLRPGVEQTGHLITLLFNRLGLGRNAHRELERKLDLIGKGETISSLYGQKFVSAIVLVAVGVAVQVAGIYQLSLAGLLAVCVAGYALPSYTLTRRVRRIREEAVDQLPGFIDLLSINVQAGMGLEGALLKVAKSGGRGVLSRAVRRAFSEAQYRELLTRNKLRSGRNRFPEEGAAALVAVEIEEDPIFRAVAAGNRNGNGNTRANSREVKGRGKTQNLTLLALGDMAERFRVTELEDFVSALETADRQGVPVTETLVGLAGVMREKRRNRLIEAGSKSTVRMLFPVALFIMPAFLLLLLTPALIEFLQLGGQ